MHFVPEREVASSLWGELVIHHEQLGSFDDLHVPHCKDCITLFELHEGARRQDEFLPSPNPDNGRSCLLPEFAF